MLYRAIPPILLALVCAAPPLAATVPGDEGAPQRFATPAGSASDLRLARGGGGASSPGEAAEQARRQTGGGRVLSVRQTGSGYEVKVLTPSGEVRLVFVAGSGG